MSLTLRDYQQAAVDHTFKWFERNPVEGNPVIGMPTGTGKSVVIAGFLQNAYRMYAGQKVLVATHVKELIQQNYEKFVKIWPTAPAGVYSAGLNKKDVWAKIIFCGIASIVDSIAEFGRIDLMIIDECHLLSQNEESMYQKVIAFLKERNPMFRVIGLTATPWRQGQGRITDDGIFTDFAFNATDMLSFNWFIQQGYLLPLTPKSTTTALDVSKVKTSMGEFNLKELQNAVNKDDITFGALQETIAQGHDRKSWLIFASGVAHVVRITEMLNEMGIPTTCVHSNTKEHKMTDKQRDKNLADWKAGKFRAMVNNGILTTGVDHPPLDLIVMLRPTQSTVLWVQMLGRGTRPDYAPGYDLSTHQGRIDAIMASDKQNCLVLDFARNTSRLGPINDPVLPRKKGEAKGEVPAKLCDHCGMYNHISARYCGGEPYRTMFGCGEEFEFKVVIQQHAATEELIKPSEEPIIEVVKVDSVNVRLHQRAGKPQTLWVTYFSGIRKFSEFILPEHQGGARRKAENWWKERTNIPLPATARQAADYFENLLVPTHLKVWINKHPYPEVMLASFTGGFEAHVSGDEVPF